MSVYCGDALQCVCKELKKFTTYNFRVSASNPHGLSKFSAISAFKTLPSEPGVFMSFSVEGIQSAYLSVFAW
jgi:hypothetical protein